MGDGYLDYSPTARSHQLLFLILGISWVVLLGAIVQHICKHALHLHCRNCPVHFIFVSFKLRGINVSANRHGGKKLPVPNMKRLVPSLLGQTTGFIKVAADCSVSQWSVQLAFVLSGQLISPLTWIELKFVCSGKMQCERKVHVTLTKYSEPKMCCTFQ